MASDRYIDQTVFGPPPRNFTPAVERPPVLETPIAVAFSSDRLIIGQVRRGKTALGLIRRLLTDYSK